jgi:hypothetical protein
MDLPPNYRLNMELDLQSLFGLHVHSCTHWLRHRTPPHPPRIWAHIRERYWSAKIDDISVTSYPQPISYPPSSRSSSEPALTPPPHYPWTPGIPVRFLACNCGMLLHCSTSILLLWHMLLCRQPAGLYSLQSHCWYAANCPPDSIRHAKSPDLQMGMKCYRGDPNTSVMPSCMGH